MKPFILTTWCDGGFDVECCAAKCHEEADYRVTLGQFQRLFCESCLIDAVLAKTPVTAEESGYMNPNGEF